MSYTEPYLTTETRTFVDGQLQYPFSYVYQHLPVPGPYMPLPWLTLSPDGEYWVDDWLPSRQVVIRRVFDNTVVFTANRPTLSQFNNYFEQLGWPPGRITRLVRAVPQTYVAGLDVIIYFCFLGEGGTPVKAYAYACNRDGSIVAQLSYLDENLHPFGSRGYLTPIDVYTPDEISWVAPNTNEALLSFVKYIES